MLQQTSRHRCASVRASIVRTISDIFGSSIVITARFESETRENGLLAIGALNNSVSEDGFERYHEIAKDVAAQVIDKNHRNVLYLAIQNQ
jgi:hypothetical protein